MKSATRLLLMLLCLAPWPASAAPICYTPVQAEAEQLLRLHSELMVITVTCRQGSEGQDLPVAYGDFTKKNIATLHQAEQTMIAYYRNNTKGDPIPHLDRLRTLLANEYGQKVARMSAPEFCAIYRDKVLDFDAAPSAALYDEAKRMQTVEKTYIPICGASTVLAKKVN